ncbi:hypothetical protein BDR07DRAFT_1391818, partial [Suillus spraguei]
SQSHAGEQEEHHFIRGDLPPNPRADTPWKARYLARNDWNLHDARTMIYASVNRTRGFQHQHDLNLERGTGLV